jgi:hypothetical protein
MCEDGAEADANQLLQTARAQHVSFGFEYNYVDEDIARIIGRYATWSYNISWATIV